MSPKVSPTTTPIQSPAQVLTPKSKAKVEQRSESATQEATTAKESAKDAASKSKGALKSARDALVGGSKAGAKNTANFFTKVSQGSQNLAHRVLVASPSELTTVRKPLGTAASLGALAGLAAYWEPAATLAVAGVTLPYLLAGAALVAVGVAVVAIITRLLTATPSVDGSPERKLNHKVASAENRLIALTRGKEKAAKRHENDVAKANEQIARAEATKKKSDENFDSKITAEQEALAGLVKDAEEKAKAQSEAAKLTEKQASAVDSNANESKGTTGETVITASAKVPAGTDAASAQADLKKSAEEIATAAA